MSKQNIDSESSFSSYNILDEHDGTLTIHQLKEKPYFSFQEAKDMPENISNKNRAIQKQPLQTIQESLQTEEKLELPGKSLKVIPKLSFNLINLKLLNLQQNLLTTVPPQIMRMNYLQKIILSNNQISILPMFLQTLKFLEYLDLSENQIKIFNINPPELKFLNISNNQLEQLFFPNLEHLCIQNNNFMLIPKGFHKVLYGMHHLEFEWFKYCKPSLPTKMNFEKYQHIKDKLISLLSSNNLNFQQFTQQLSVSEINFNQTDYKYRNLFFQAGFNYEIGVIHCLMQIIPELINALDFDQNTPVSACYYEIKTKSVKALLSLGGKFASQSIHVITQRVDLTYLKVILQLNEDGTPTSQTDYSLIQLRNIDGNTPLHQLFMNFNKNQDAIEMADILMKLGSNPNAENNEGWSPLDLAVRKGQVDSIKYAIEYNKKLYTQKQELFDFNKKSGFSEWSLAHVAASVGNIEILELLSIINVDMLQVSKCNRLPKHLAIQSLTMLKNMRKLERRWIIRNVLLSNNFTDFAEKNVYQMKYQIEKNMAKKHLNVAPKVFEIDDENFDLDENSLQIASENSIKEIVSDSVPIFRRIPNKNITSMQIEKQNMCNLDQSDFADHLPDIQKLLRNQQYDQALYKLKNAILSDLLPLSERLKYKNYLNVIHFKLKYPKIQMQQFLKNNLNLILSEFSLKSISNENKNKLIKELNMIKRDQNRHEIHKNQFNIEKIQTVCKNELLHVDLLAKDLNLIQDLRSRLSNNLIYDITNYAEILSIINDQIYYWGNSSQYLCEKLIINSNISNLINYEGFQKMRFIKKNKIKDKDIDNIEQDMIEDFKISSYQQFTYVITNNKRF